MRFPTYPKARMLEWQHSIIFMLLGIVLVLPVKLLSSSITFSTFIKVLPLELVPYAGGIWGVFFLTLGIGRMAILLIEKILPYSCPVAISRIIASIVYMLVLNMIIVAFVVIWPEGLWIASVYFGLMLFELITVWRATTYLKNLWFKS